MLWGALLQISLLSDAAQHRNADRVRLSKRSQVGEGSVGYARANKGRCALWGMERSHIFTSRLGAPAPPRYILNLSRYCSVQNTVKTVGEIVLVAFFQIIQNRFRQTFAYLPCHHFMCCYTAMFALAFSPAQDTVCRRCRWRVPFPISICALFCCCGFFLICYDSARVPTFHASLLSLCGAQL